FAARDARRRGSRRRWQASAHAARSRRQARRQQSRACLVRRAVRRSLRAHPHLGNARIRQGCHRLGAFSLFRGHMSIWSFPTKIVFGAGEIERLGQETAALGVSRVLLVADAGVEKNGLLNAPLSALSKAGLVTSVFTGVDANPTEQNIEHGAKAYAAHRAEAVVAVGGGSPMDAAKLIALRAVCGLPFEQLDDAIDGGVH